MKTDESSEPRMPEPTNDPTDHPETLSPPPLPAPAPPSPPALGPATPAASPGRPVVLRPINLADIRLDAGTQIRAGVTEEVVSEYAERMLAGDQFPPADAFFDGKAYYLADGFHRVEASKRIDCMSAA